MILDDIKEQLEAWFPPELHKVRKLPGGGRWFYLPHQAIMARLNQVCYSHWSDNYNPPIVSGDYVTVFCQLTICGVTRTGIADSKTYPELNDEGKEKIIGTPVVNTTRHSFRDAAERFGVGAYLDEQKGKGKERFIQYMNSKGDKRAQEFNQENEWKEAGVMGERQEVKNLQNRVITFKQANRLHAIASRTGWNEAAKLKLLAQYGYQHAGEICLPDYEKIISTLEDKAMCSRFQQLAQQL
jgi:hypothetical protein